MLYFGIRLWLTWSFKRICLSGCYKDVFSGLLSHMLYVLYMPRALRVFVPYMLYLPGTFTCPPVLITLRSFVHSRPFLFCVFYVLLCHCVHSYLTCFFFFFAFSGSFVWIAFIFSIETKKFCSDSELKELLFCSNLFRFL